MPRLFFILLLFALPCVTPSWAQDQAATMTPEERLKRMRATEGRMPADVVTSFKRRTVDSNEKPWRAIGRVNIGGRAHCSGALVGERLALTAAHCMFSQSSQSMVVPSIVHFLAGYARGEYRAHSKVKSYFIPDGFDGSLGADKANLPYDWALLTLEEPIGEQEGFVLLHENMRTLAHKTTRKNAGPLLQTPMVITAGYPGDRAHILSLEENCRIRNVLYHSRVMLTDCLSLKGDSGGPILQKNGDSYVLIGVQTASTKVGKTQASMGVTALAFAKAIADLQAHTSH